MVNKETNQLKSGNNPLSSTSTEAWFNASAPQFGNVSAKLVNESSKTASIFVQTTVAASPGAFLPLKLIHPQSGDQVATVCRVVRKVMNEEGNVQTGIELLLPEDDARVRNTLIGWAKKLLPVENILPGQSLEQTASTADAALPDLDHLIEDAAGSKEAAPQAKSKVETATIRERNEAARIDSARIISEAQRAIASGNFERAFDLLGQAANIFPVNAEQLYLQQAKIALEQLNDLNRALAQAKAAIALAPSDFEVKRVLDLITARITEDAAQRDKAARRFKFESLRTRSVAIVGVAVLVVAAVLGWSTWRYLLPRGKTPTQIEAAAFSGVMPIRQAKLHRSAVYLTIESAGWTKLTETTKRENLRRLATIARERFGVTRVVLADPQPAILGTVTQDKIVLGR